MGESVDRRLFLKKLGAGASVGALAGSAVDSAQAQQRKVPERGVESKRPGIEIAEHYRVAEAFADNFVKMIGKFRQIRARESEQIRAACKLYFESFARSRNTQPNHKLNALALQFSLRKIQTMQNVGIAQSILGDLYDEYMLLDAADDSSDPLASPSSPNDPEKTSG